MHWPDPAQRPRITEIRDNLIARIAEAEREVSFNSPSYPSPNRSMASVPGSYAIEAP